jgi:hypothetical protein
MNAIGAEIGLSVSLISRLIGRAEQAKKQDLMPSMDGRVAPIDVYGFQEPADRRIAAMLAFVDVNELLYGPGNLGARRTDSQTGVAA